MTERTAILDTADILDATMIEPGIWAWQPSETPGRVAVTTADHLARFPAYAGAWGHDAYSHWASEPGEVWDASEAEAEAWRTLR